MEIEDVPEDELRVRLHVARVLAEFAQNRQDEASEYRWAFETNLEAVKETYAKGPPLEGRPEPMTELEREYLRDTKVPVVVPRDPVREHEIFVEFKAAAESYMRVIDSAEGDADEYLINVARTLAPLLAVAYRLPDIWDDEWTFPGERSVEERIKAEQNVGFGGQLDGRHEYVTVVAFGRDVPENDADAVLLGGSLFEDLGSIYTDVEDGLHMLAKGSSEGEVIYTWHWGFWNHWGEHAVDGLRIVHAQVAGSQGGGTSIGG